MRTCGAQLFAHMSGTSTTMCFLLKVGPLPNDAYIRTTSLDRNVVYDCGDGLGEQTYYASTGTQLSAMQSANDLSVDNGEAQTLVELPTYPNTGITEAMVDAGTLDGVEFVVYGVNYRDLTMGHYIEAGGPVGEIRYTLDGLITLELRAWTDLLRQNSVTERDSLTCRVKKFGSQPGEERFPCMYDASGELGAEFTVTSVGTENVRDFTVAALGAAADYYAPGNWIWTEGDNEGMTREIESQSGGGAISLLFTTRFPIQVGDKGRPKRDCTRQWEGHNSCETYANRQWFRGEPFIPVSDTIALTTPFAGAGGAQ